MAQRKYVSKNIPEKVLRKYKISSKLTKEEKTKALRGAFLSGLSQGTITSDSLELPTVVHKDTALCLYDYAEEIYKLLEENKI